MAEQILTLKKFVVKWSKKTLRSMKDIIAKKGIAPRTRMGNSNLARTMKIRVLPTKEGSFKVTLKMNNYGIFLDKGVRSRMSIARSGPRMGTMTKGIKATKFIDPFRAFRKAIPNLKKIYAEYVKEQIANSVNNN